MRRLKLPERIGPAPTRVVLPLLALVFGLLVLQLVFDRPAGREPSETAAGLPVRVADGPDPLDWPGSLVDISLKLVAVLALLYLALAALRRYAVGPQVGRRGLLQVMDSTTLAPNRGLYLVRARDRWLLLGVTADRISALTTWEDELELPDLSTSAADAPAVQPSFEHLLG